MKLTSVVKRLISNNSPEALMDFSRVLKELVDNNGWIHMPIIEDSKGTRLVIMNDNGKAYAVMYSDASEKKARGHFAITDINRLLEPVFQAPAIAGIVIDPDTTALCLDKEFLLTCLVHGYLPLQNNSGGAERDWGFGIPTYKESDLMTEGEMLNFAMHVVLDKENSFSAYTPISACDHPSAIANLIFKKESGSFIFVRVKGSCAECSPVLSDNEKKTLLDYSKRFNATCYFAPVGLRSGTDLARFNACLALRGDGFCFKYDGLELVC